MKLIIQAITILILIILTLLLINYIYYLIITTIVGKALIITVIPLTLIYLIIKNIFKRNWFNCWHSIITMLYLF